MDRVLYEDRSAIRMLAMRRTMFVVAIEDVPMVHSAASLAVARTERKRNEQFVALLGVEDAAEWLTAAREATIVALERLGEATTQELALEVPALPERVRVNIGKPYEAEVSMSSRVLLALAVEGRIVRSRRRGSWISGQYRWTSAERWFRGPIDPVPVDAAQAELVRRWLGRFGPGTETDLRWWTGFTAREIRAALATVGAVTVDLDGGAGFCLPHDLEPTPLPEPWVALTPGLDPTLMGWKERDWYLGEHKAALFGSTGNGGPAVWADGRIVGGWAVRPGGEVVWKLLEDVGREKASGVEAEAARLTEFLSAVAVVPRFPTPLERELVS